MHYQNTSKSYLPHPTMVQKIINHFPVENTLTIIVCKYTPSQNIQAKLHTTQYCAITCRTIHQTWKKQSTSIISAPYSRGDIYSFPHGWLITWFATGVTRRMSHVEKEMLTFPDHLSSPPDFSGVCLVLSFVFCVAFSRSFFGCFILGHCIVCPSLIDGFW